MKKPTEEQMKNPCLTCRYSMVVNGEQVCLDERVSALPANIARIEIFQAIYNQHVRNVCVYGPQQFWEAIKP